MKKYIENIYELIHSPLVTPYNLIENALLDNYGYVKYYTENNFFVAEMSCTLDNGETELFYYYFKDIYNLQYIYKGNSQSKIIVFDRSKELDLSKQEFYNAYQEKLNKSAI